MKEQIQQLIEDYKRRVKTIGGLISENNSRPKYDTVLAERLITEQSEYRTFISELERILNNENQNP